MTTLENNLHTLTDAVANGQRGLEDALDALEDWLAQHAHTIAAEERATFRAGLERESSNDTRSLVDSVLRLHTTRLLMRYEDAQPPTDTAPDAEPNDYTRARDAFNAALKQSETGLREARIDITLANTHTLLGDLRGNRQRLDAAYEHTQPLAALDLPRLADAIPPMPAPEMGKLKRFGLRMMGVNLDKLAARNLESFSTLARLQTNEIVLLAHLLGTSYETLRERQRANRAYRIVAHLVTRYNGLPGEDAENLIAIAEDIQRAEPDAARSLAQQAYSAFRDAEDADGQARARALLDS